MALIKHKKKKLRRIPEDLAFNMIINYNTPYGCDPSSLQTLYRSTASPGIKAESINMIYYTR